MGGREGGDRPKLTHGSDYLNLETKEQPEFSPAFAGYPLPSYSSEPYDLKEGRKEGSGKERGKEEIYMACVWGDVCYSH